MKNKDSVLVGLTGGMGCGQTTVAGFFEKRGAKIVNADRVSRSVVNRDEEVQKDIRKTFGNKVFYRNGSLNRKLLAKIVFTDPHQVRRLNKIVHPKMVAKTIEALESARFSGKFQVVVFDAALIYELNLEHAFDTIVVVASRIGNRIARVKERDDLDEIEIRNRIDQQIPIEDKIKWADFVVHNNSTLEKLEEKSDVVFKKILRVNNRPVK